MKKSILCALVALMCTMFVGCGESGSHSFQIYHPNPQGMFGPIQYLYADETNDSVVFSTTDSYVMRSLEPTWLTLEDGREEVTGKVQNDGMSLYLITTRVSATPNATGKTREGAVQIKTEKFSGMACYTQYPVFRFVRPRPYRESIDSIAIVLNDSSKVTKDSVTFNIQNDWTLAIDQDSATIDWLSIDKTNGAKGLNTVHLTFNAPNTTERDRHAYLVLQSIGITNRIRINQLKQKK